MVCCRYPRIALQRLGLKLRTCGMPMSKHIQGWRIMMVIQLGLTTAAFVFAGKIFELPLCSTRCCTKTMDLDVRSNLVCMAGIALDLQGQRCGRVPLTWSLICIPLHTASVSKGRTLVAPVRSDTMAEAGRNWQKQVSNPSMISLIVIAVE